MRTLAVQCAALLVMALAAQCASGSGVLTVNVNASAAQGPFTLVHGADNGPLCSNGVNYGEIATKELGMSLIRTHDMVVLDWFTYYPHPAQDVDPEEPASYDFSAGDAAFSAIINAGMRPYFRLGPSWTSPAWAILPLNFSLFARTCVRALQHYNEGNFAGGFSGHAVTRVEIWNEPDEARFWNGTAQQFYQLVDTVARAIRAYDPTITIALPALALIEDTPYFTDLLQYLATAGTPFDAFSWHRYGWPWARNGTSMGTWAGVVRSALETVGGGVFASKEQFVTEWNIGVLTNITDSALAATYVADVLSSFIATNVSLSIFYPGCNVWGLLNDTIPGQVHYRPMTWAYRAVAETMRDTPQQVGATAVVTGGSGGGGGAAAAAASAVAGVSYAPAGGNTIASLNAVVSANGYVEAGGPYTSITLTVSSLPPSSCCWNVTAYAITDASTYQPVYASSNVTVSGTGTVTISLPLAPPAVLRLSMTKLT